MLVYVENACISHQPREQTLPCSLAIYLSFMCLPCSRTCSRRRSRWRCCPRSWPRAPPRARQPTSRSRPCHLRQPGSHWYGWNYTRYCCPHQITHQITWHARTPSCCCCCCCCGGWCDRRSCCRGYCCCRTRCGRIRSNPPDKPVSRLV